MPASPAMRPLICLLFAVASTWCAGQQKEGGALLIAFQGPMSASEAKRAFEVLVDLDPTAAVTFSNNGSLAKFRGTQVGDGALVHQALQDAGFHVTIVPGGGQLPWSSSTKAMAGGPLHGAGSDPGAQDAAKQSWIEAHPDAYQRLIGEHVQRATSP